MKNFLEEKKSFVYLLMVVMFLCILLFYVYQIKPLKEEAENMKTSISSLETDIKIVESQLESSDTEKEEDLSHILPQSEAVNELIRNLAAIGNRSGSSILNISVLATSPISEEEAASIQEEGTEEEGSSPNLDGNLTEIANVNYVSLQLNVISPTKDAFRSFLEGIEDMERITRVDSLSFSEPSSNDDSSISFNLVISSFFYDGEQK